MRSGAHTMDAIIRTLQSLPWQKIAGLGVTYIITVVLYRLYLHPLARFPGPRLAAATRWYEGYYDVVLDGQYTFKIGKLHEKYGPIVRISPHELHISDPSFYDQLYRHDGVWQKYEWANKAFGVPAATITCVDHDLHKRRRAPLERFLSKANVVNNVNIITRLTARLSERIGSYAGKQETVNVGSAISAFVRDVATEFLLGRSYDNLGNEDFNAGMTAVFQGGGHVWRVTKHVPWFGPALQSMPPSLVERIGDQGAKDFFKFLKDTLDITKELLAQAKGADFDAKTQPRTMVHAIASSNMPESEKELQRVYDDVSTVTGAAFETTAATLRLILFFVYSNPEILQKIRAELAEGRLNKKSAQLELSDLEKLPYLTAVLTEGLRMSPGVATRLARVAPDRDLIYGSWRIPRGTPVGMTTVLMHYDEVVFKEPEQFQPERWLDASNRRSLEKSFGPFSKGTRICAGFHLAWAELYLVIAAFVGQFDLNLQGAGLKDVRPTSDQFIAGTEDRSGIKALVTEYQN